MFLLQGDGPFRRTGTQIHLQQGEAWSQLGAISLTAGGAGEHMSQSNCIRRFQFSGGE